MLRRILTSLLLAVLLPVGEGALAGEPLPGEAGRALRERLHAHDQGVVDGWEAPLRERLERLGAPYLDESSRAAVDAIRNLIDSPRLPFAQDREIVGPCRLRSLQIDESGVSIHAWSGCSIESSREGLLFRQHEGDERRFGLIGRDAVDRFFFYGGRYPGDQPPRGYSSGFTTAPDPAERERDSIALLYRLGDGRFLMAYAPQSGRFELRELQQLP